MNIEGKALTALMLMVCIHGIVTSYKFNDCSEPDTNCMLIVIISLCGRNSCVMLSGCNFLKQSGLSVSQSVFLEQYIENEVK